MVVTRVQTVYKIEIRTETGIGWRRNFLEKMASYAGLRVRRALMPRLLKKVATPQSNGQKRSRSTTFNANVHVKKEITQNEMNVDEVTTDNSTLHGMSTLTEESTRDIDVCKTQRESITRDLVCALELEFQGSDEILRRIKSRLHYKMERDDANKVEKESNAPEHVTIENHPVSLNPPIPDLVSSPPQQLHEVLPLPTQEFDTSLLPENTHIHNMDMQLAQDVTVLKCEGECKIECKWVDSRSSVLEDIFGEGIGCVKCGKSIFDCMTKGMNKGAYICVRCKDKKCRQMFCNTCYVTQNNGTRQTRRGGRAKKVAKV